jgi:Holliday junction resolvase RusA-like endonuclease
MIEPIESFSMASRFQKAGRTEQFERHLGWAAKAVMAGRGPSAGAISITAVFEITMSPTAKPDLDNYVKSALDALKGIVFFDDCQVVAIDARKVCSSKPRTTLTIIIGDKKYKDPWETD